MNFANIIEEVLIADYKLKHNDTVRQIESIFRNNGFYTTREYPIYKMGDGSGKKGRIDLVARKGRFRVAVEYDHHKVIKWKSFQKIIQINPECAIAISGDGGLKENIVRASHYVRKLRQPLYVVSLKEKAYTTVRGVENDG